MTKIKPYEHIGQERNRGRFVLTQLKSSRPPSYSNTQIPLSCVHRFPDNTRVCDHIYFDFHGDLSYKVHLKHAQEEDRQLGSKWHILFCDAQMEGCPVTEFIEACRPRHQVKILRFLSLLEEQGPILPRPYADLLYDGIHELRVKLSGGQVRILYFFCYQKFIVLYYAFVKTSSKVPDKFIRKVIAYKNNFIEQVSPGQLEEIVGADI